ncbi:MAG TPA: hypothetical protein DEQ32_10990 [Gammaproteobacteria bacterium]|nr:hypothetical protein [Gammaproteobacteria bacterium]
MILAPSLWQETQFRLYLGSVSFSGAAMAMQQLLITWLLVGILMLPATQVGAIQALIGLPGIALMLWGGAVADRTDPRGLLIQVYSLAWLFPIALFTAVQLDLLNIWSVSVFGLAMSTAIAYASPSQQAILNRIAGSQVQRGVTLSTIASFLVQIIGLAISGQMENVGVDTILMIQSLSLVLAALAVRQLAAAEASPAIQQKTIAVIFDGFRAVIEKRTILHTMIITFVSGIFNYGAFAIALPYIVKRIYEGDAIGFATMMVIFYTGATISNVIQYWVMPLTRPGFWFLAMQLTRALLLYLIWLQPEWWILLLVMFFWGLNMGITTNLSRAIVQETSDPKFLARLLSVFSLGMMGAIPIGAIAIGLLVGWFGEVDALIPSMFISIGLFAYGFIFTKVGDYRSPATTGTTQ